MYPVHMKMYYRSKFQTVNERKFIKRIQYLRCFYFFYNALHHIKYIILQFRVSLTSFYNTRKYLNYRI